MSNTIASPPKVTISVPRGPLISCLFDHNVYLYHFADLHIGYQRKKGSLKISHTAIFLVLESRNVAELA